MGEEYLTFETLKKMKDELNYLKNVKKKELIKEIAEAREHGDLRENVEYHAAREERARVEARIKFLEAKISQAKLIEKEKFPDDVVCIGAKVKLKDLNKNSELSYKIVSPVEADYDSGKISITSPVAKGLLGKKVGDVVKINVPAGLLHYEILSISR